MTWKTKHKSEMIKAPQTILSRLRELNQNGKLCLFVGAGISIGCGLPNWTDLAHLLAHETWLETDKKNKAIYNIATEQNPLNIARFARWELKENFNKVIAKCLYNNDIKVSDAVISIANSGVCRICSLNFDDILEETFKQEGIKCRPLIEGRRFSNNYKGVIIFHPHGFLPRNATEEAYRKCNIILSEDDYNNLYSDSYSWPNIIQISLLLNYTVLFVGISINDPNLRRLLDLKKRLGITHKHYAILRSPLTNPQAKGKKKQFYKQLKLFKESELTQLGVNIIWIEKYNDLSKVIKKIAC